MRRDYWGNDTKRKFKYGKTTLQLVVWCRWFCLHLV
jgi:hypothetical protein